MHLYKLPAEISTRNMSYYFTRRPTLTLVAAALLIPPRNLVHFESWRAALDPFWRLSLSLDFVFVGPSHKTRPLYSSWRAFFSHRPLDDDHYYCGVTAVKTSSSRVPLYATKPPLMGPISSWCQQPEKKSCFKSIKTWAFVILLSGPKSENRFLWHKNSNWQKQD